MSFNFANENTHQSDSTSHMKRQSDENCPSYESGLPGISSNGTTVTNDCDCLMSDEHISPLFIHHCSSFIVRFVLLVVLLIFSRKYFVVFWGFHVLIFVIAVIICKSLGQDKIYVNNKLEQDDIDKLKGLGIKDAKLVNVPLVTLFSEDSNFYLEYHCLFYFVIPFLENLILFIYMCYLIWATQSTTLFFLVVFLYVTIFISCFQYFWCYLHSLFTLTDDKTDTDEENQSSSRRQSSLISIFFHTILCTDLPSIKGGLKWYRNNRHVRHDHQVISIPQIDKTVIVDELGAAANDQRHFPMSFEEQFQDADRKYNLSNPLFWSHKNHKDLNSTNSKATVLICWCENYQQENLLDIAKMLIESSEHPREYVNSKNVLEETALHQLCVHYSHENLFSVVKLFIENGADVNAASYLQNRTPLLQLCKYYQGDNLIDIVELLIQKGADVNAADSGGRTPLLELCHNYGKINKIDIIHLLIKNGANVNAKDSAGKTPLIELCDPCQTQVKIEVIQLLMDSGVSNDDGVAIQVEMLLEENQVREQKLSVKFNEVYRSWNEERKRKTSHANALLN